MPLPFPSPYSFLHPLIPKFVNDVLTFWFRVFFAVTNPTSRNSILYSEAEGERWFCPARYFGTSAECLGSWQARPILALQYLWQRERVPPWASRASAISTGRSHRFRRTNGDVLFSESVSERGYHGPPPLWAGLSIRITKCVSSYIHISSRFLALF